MVGILQIPPLPILDLLTTDFTERIMIRWIEGIAFAIGLGLVALLNACEAVSENGMIITRTWRRGEIAGLTVEDNGKGMSSAFLAKELFQPFHTTKSSGLGIGLFHSKKIVEAHQGSITVESEEGKGTKVTLTFPITAP